MSAETHMCTTCSAVMLQEYHGGYVCPNFRCPRAGQTIVFARPAASPGGQERATPIERQPRVVKDAEWFGEPWRCEHGTWPRPHVIRCHVCFAAPPSEDTGAPTRELLTPTPDEGEPYPARAALQGDGEAPTGAALIAAERARQISAEGWTPEHDATHTNSELALAAACYAWPAPRPLEVKKSWPWNRGWWKPTIPETLPAACGCRSVGECNHIGAITPAARNAARIRDLVKAGALIAAEIDRLAALLRSSPARDATGDET